MTENDFEKTIEELNKQLGSSKQNWLLGAGVSANSNIPLMDSLTSRVKTIIEGSEENATRTKNIEIYNQLAEELDKSAHIEHYLSHIGDLIALAERSKSKNAKLGNLTVEKEELTTLHKTIIDAIGETVRYGYCKKNNEIGTQSKPIIKIEDHINFVQAIYSNRTNLQSRSKFTFFTTNYDTLLEDALGLEKFIVVDGFSGGAVAYWNPQHEFKNTDFLPNKCLLYKLHGSIDWLRNEKKGIIRTRYGTNYFDKESTIIMIYPQATKYVETQKDPFSYLFSGFRNALNSPDDNVLITCGYSFGDKHINDEIEAALVSRENRTNLVAFAKEYPGESVVINSTLDAWLQNKQFGSRVYVAGEKGIYYNSIIPITPPEAKDLNWWMFSGLTNFISTGEI